MSNLNPETGLVTYNTPGPGKIIIIIMLIIIITIVGNLHLDDPFCTWSGSIVSHGTGISTLIFVALNGYHGVAKYCWILDSMELEEEVYPILYTRSTGIFQCTISTPNVEATKEFHITSTRV